MQQAHDFESECQQIDALLTPLGEADYARSTGFKQWTIEDILRHLHVWNVAAFLSLTDKAGFDEYWQQVSSSLTGGDVRTFERAYSDGIKGAALLAQWREFYPKVADAFAKADPKARLPWAGPSMSARSSITARLMESWSHAQAIYDELGVERPGNDAVIANVVVMGLNTYGWTFANRKLDVPEPRPQLRLTMPSGAEQIFGDDAGEEWIAGTAQEFCQVVTQCRNVADTGLEVSGTNARAWMEKAQCFAGPPQDPPAPGLRRMRAS